MRSFKKVIRVLVVAALCMSMAAIPYQPALAKGPDARDIMKQAEEKSAALESGKADLKMDMQVDMSLLGLTESMTMEFQEELTFFTDPMKAKTKVKMTLAYGADEEAETFSEEGYLAGEGKKYYSYMKYGNKWKKELLDLDAFDQSITGFGMDAFDDLVEYKLLSDTEKVGSRDAYLIEATMTEATVREMMEAMSLEWNLDLDSMKNFEKVSMKCWIDKDTMYPIKISMDLRSMMQSIIDFSMKYAMEEIGKDMDDDSMEMMKAIRIKVPKCTFVIMFDDMDQAQDFTLPGYEAPEK